MPLADGWDTTAGLYEHQRRLSMCDISWWDAVAQTGTLLLDALSSDIRKAQRVKIWVGDVKRGKGAGN